MTWHHYHATNTPDTCLWCGRKLRKNPHREKLGDYGDGFFCGLRCGFQFGERLAELDNRLTPRAEPPAQPKTRRRYPPCPECKRRLYFADGGITAHRVDYLECGTFTCSCHTACSRWAFEKKTHVTEGGNTITRFIRGRALRHDE